MQGAKDTLGGRLEMIKPLGRPLRDLSGYLPFLVRARWGATTWSADPPVFVIGCGRSGTTLLGELLGLHPGAWYLYEPRQRWAAVCRATDVALAFSRRGGHAFMDASFATPSARVRFSRVMSPPSGQMLVEKSPANALRIPFLDALAPDARFIHIVRDGDEVVRSIAGKAARTRRVFGRGQVNDWWGSNDSKWTLLAEQGSAAGHYPDEVRLLATNLDRAAYEWLVSLAEVDSARQTLNERLHEITYRELTERPADTLAGIARFLRLSAPTDWIDHAAGQIRFPRRTGAEPLLLPPSMSEDFNGFQRRYGFGARATAADKRDDRNAAPAR
jgi:hypothetical protein